MPREGKLATLNRHEVEIKEGTCEDRGSALVRRIVALGKTFAEERPVEPVENARERAQRWIGWPSMVTNFRS